MGCGAVRWMVVMRVALMVMVVQGGQIVDAARVAHRGGAAAVVVGNRGAIRRAALLASF